MTTNTTPAADALRAAEEALNESRRYVYFPNDCDERGQPKPDGPFAKMRRKIDDALAAIRKTKEG